MMPESAQQASVLVTLKDVYEKQSYDTIEMTKALNDIKLQVAGMTAKLTEATTERERNQVVHDDHERRIRGLEKYKYAIPSSLVAALVALLIALLNAATKALGHG